MEDFKGTLPEHPFEPATRVKLEEQDMRLYDADTLIKDTGQSYRILGLDAPEMPSVKPMEGYTEGLFADEYRDETKKYIEEKGFDQVKPIDEKDVYGRDLVRLENEIGQDLAYESIREGIFEPSRYNLNDPSQQEAWTSTRFDALIGAQQDLPPWKQMENTIYQNSVPRLGELTWQEQRRLPSSLTPVNKAIDKSFGGQAVDAVEMWWYQNIGAWEGIKALAGSEEGFQGMKDIQATIQQEIDPGTIMSLSQINDTSDALAFIQNNLIMHGPDFAVLYGSGKAGAMAGTAVAGPVGGAIGGILGGFAGLGYMFLKTTGNVAQEQFEVTGDVDLPQAVTLGVAITAIDKLGATAVIKPTDLLTKKGLANAVTQYKGLQASKGITLTTSQAREAIEKVVASDINKLATDFTLRATDYLTKRQIAIGTALRISRNAGKEAATEATQEAIQYLGINGMPETAEQWERFGLRLADAAAAGGVVGTGFNIPNSLLERNRIENNRDQVTEYDPEKSNLTEKLSVEFNAQNKYRTIEETIQDYKGPAKTDINERAERHNKGYGRRALDKLLAGNYIPGLSAVKNAVRPFLINKTGQANKAAVLLANIQGAYQTMPGNTLFNQEQTRIANIIQDHPWLSSTDIEFGLDVQQTSDLIDELAEVRFQVNQLAPEKQQAAQAIKDSLDTLHNEIVSEMMKAGYGLDDFKVNLIRNDPYYLLTKGLPDTHKIFNNSQRFMDLLSNHVLPNDYGRKKAGEKVGEEYAHEVLSRIFSNQAHSQRTVVNELNAMGAKDAIKEFFPDNTYENIRNKAIGELTKYTRIQYLGENNEVISNIIDELEETKAITPEQADALAADMVDQLKKHTREFGRLRNETFANIQDIARVMTSLGLMDNVLFAQMAESVFAFSSTNKGLAKNVGTLAHNFVKAFKHTIPSIKKKRAISGESEIYKRLGYHSDELLQQQGADMNNKLLLEIQKYFYKLNLLEPATDAIRMSRMVLALDSISQMVEQLIDVDLSNMNRQQAKLYERLSHYGADVPKLTKIYKRFRTLSYDDIDKIAKTDDKVAVELKEAWDVMLPKFIDEFTVRIKPGSRPSIFEDQRYGLPFLTQYLSFTAHFHSNILPRLYTTYLKDATAPVAFSTFKIMMSAIVVAYISQYLKDLLLRGELNENLEEDYGAMQRAINYSGQLGWAQEIIDNVVGNPYGFKSEGLLDYISGYPVYGHTSKVLGDLAEGDFASAAQRAIPFADYTKETAAPTRLINFIIGENE